MWCLQVTAVDFNSQAHAPHNAEGTTSAVYADPSQEGIEAAGPSQVHDMYRWRMALPSVITAC